VGVGCAVCQGAGVASLAIQAAALVAAAGFETCEQCGGPLDDDAVTDEALTTVCGACAEANEDAAREAWQAEIAANHAAAVHAARLAA
jgi:hypothetical protein